MDRVAVFVDAGYLFAQGAIALCGEKLTRGNVTLDYESVKAALRTFAEQVSSLQLLRIYWYDGTSQGPTAQHIALAGRADVKVRLGFVNSLGKQKGVDSLIMTDMITLARNRAMAECVLLSGDEDLRVGVQQAQEHGVRVHLLGVKPAGSNQSIFLRQEADATHEWDESDLSAFMTCNRPADLDGQAEASAPDVSASADASGALDRVAQQAADEVPAAEIEALVSSIQDTGQRPRSVDAQLLAMSRSALGRSLNPLEKAEVRKAFLRALAARSIEQSPARD